MTLSNPAFARLAAAISAFALAVAMWLPIVDTPRAAPPAATVAAAPLVMPELA